MIPMNDMRQRIGGQRIGQLGGGGDKPFEGRPAACIVDGFVEGGLIFMRFQQG